MIRCYVSSYGVGWRTQGYRPELPCNIFSNSLQPSPNTTGHKVHVVMTSIHQCARQHHNGCLLSWARLCHRMINKTDS